MNEETIKTEHGETRPFSEVVDAENGDKFPEDFKLPPGKTMFFRYVGGIPMNINTFGYTLQLLLETLRLRWARITETYAECRIDLL